MYPSGRGPAYSGPTRWGLYSRPIALTQDSLLAQEGRSQVDDVFECVRDWRVRRGEKAWTACQVFIARPFYRRGLLSGLGPTDWRLLFNVSQQTHPNRSLHRRQRDWHLDAANQGASSGHIL